VVFDQLALVHQSGTPIVEVDAYTGLGWWRCDNWRWGVRAAAALPIESPTDVDDREDYVAGQLLLPDSGLINLRLHPFVRAPLGERSTFPAIRSRELLNSYHSASEGDYAKGFWSFGLGGKLVQQTLSGEGDEDSTIKYEPMGYAVAKIGLDGGFSGVDAHQTVPQPGWFSLSAFVMAGAVQRSWISDQTDGQWDRSDVLSAGGELSLRVFGRLAILARGSMPLHSQLRDALGETYSIGIAVDTSR